MNAVEIKNLKKSFRGMNAVDGLNLTVPQGAIYGFIGENGSGKSTTEKLICGLLVPTEGEIKLFGRDYRDAGVRAKVGALIESPGCFPNSSVWTNLKMQALNLNVKNPDEEIKRVLKIVRMEGSASNKFKNCSLGMKQRIGIAMALLGNPALLILDEPINGLDADGMRIMREILVDITKNYNATVLISSHILSELEKIATHYGIIRQGKLIKEVTAEEMEKSCREYVRVKSPDMEKAFDVLDSQFDDVRRIDDHIEVYAKASAEQVNEYLVKNGVAVSEIKKSKIGLEEYYLDAMKEKEAV